MPTIPEILFHSNEVEKICYETIDFFRELNMTDPWNNSKVIQLKEINAIDLSSGARDTTHLDGNDCEKNNIYFINCLFVNNEKLSIYGFENYNIHFYNCVFYNRIHLVCSPPSIIFDKCVFVEGLSLRLALFDNTNSIELSASSITKIDIYDGNINHLSITSCYIEKFLLNDIECESFHLYLNKIKNICLSNLLTNNINFDPNQIDRLNEGFFFTNNLKHAITYNHKKTERIVNRIKLFFKGEAPSYEYKVRMLNTLEFLKQNTIYKFIPAKRSSIEYLKQDIVHSGSKLRFLAWLFGYFLRPLRIIFLSFFTVIYFGILYAGNIDSLSTTKDTSLNFLDCLYFSGITFFTIGYGEITPLANMKFLVLLEGFLGVFISGLFIVVFAKHLFSD